MPKKFEKAVKELRQELNNAGVSVIHWVEDRNISTIAVRVQKRERIYVIRADKFEWPYDDGRAFSIYKADREMPSILEVFQGSPTWDRKLAGICMSAKEIAEFLKNL